MLSSYATGGNVYRSHGDWNCKEGEINATKHQVAELSEDDDNAGEHERDAEDAVETAVVRAPDHSCRFVDVHVLQQLKYNMSTTPAVQSSIIAASVQSFPAY